jgi:hypothetical protein
MRPLPIKFRFVEPGHGVEHRPSGTVHRVERGKPYRYRLAGVILLARPPANEVPPCVE